MDDNNASEELAYNQNSTGVVSNTCDENRINILNTEVELDVKYIQSINGTNYISMNDDANFIHKYYAPFLPSEYS